MQAAVGYRLPAGSFTAIDSQVRHVGLLKLPGSLYLQPSFFYLRSTFSFRIQYGFFIRLSQTT